MVRSRRKAYAVRTSSLSKESANFHWRDYAGSTSIHGVKYVAEPRRPIVEKVWWIFVLMACLTGNVLLIRKMWLKYDEMPPPPISVYEIPFPAVTICNEMKAKKSFFDKLNQTEEGWEQLETLDIVLSLTDIDFKEYQSKDGSTWIYPNRSEIADFLTKATPSVDEMMESCEFGTNRLTTDSDERIPELSIESTCSKMFSKVFTDSGVCHTFNALPITELLRNDVDHGNHDHGRHSSWSAENGYKEEDFDENQTIPIYPYRTYSGGRLFGISVELKTLRSDVMLSRYGATMAGFKVILHSPEDFPQVGDASIQVPPNTLVTTMVSSKIKKTADGLRSYKPHQRGCYYQHERKLKYFQVYTLNNCWFECLVNLTYSYCDCTALHMPKTKDGYVCDPEERLCLIMAEVGMNSRYSTESCSCLPACFSVEYDYKIKQSEYRSRSWMKLNRSGYDASKLEIFFEKATFQPDIRREVVDFVDFLASCGGLLGLFSGMSIISFGEIVYYLTFRLWTNVRLIKKSSFDEKEAPIVQTISSKISELDQPKATNHERNNTV